ncbi:DUF4230 domain-containing protein [Streptococcus sp. H31]|uniref:DUF4230 domain-containing protein n=1 Tax=Streptococcus huangxiaojuni TaxID=3237239 RepID=UPI0034A17C0B
MGIIKKILGYKVYAWLLICLSFVVLVLSITYNSAAKQTDNNTQSASQVHYLEKVNEVVFLNAGIHQVIKKSNVSSFFGIDIPFSKKTALIIVHYKAKFGIKNNVTIKQTGENSYTVKVPKLQVIGIELDGENPYELYDSNGELLSFSTQNIDTGELVTNEISNKRQQVYLKEYKEMIEESARDYYKNIFSSINVMKT